jgi:glucose-1-phosphate thymidylyltransferase
MIACPEEIAYRMGYIDAGRLEGLAAAYASNAYGRYLQALLKDRLTVAVRTAEQWRR